VTELVKKLKKVDGQTIVEGMEIGILVSVFFICTMAIAPIV
jgi:hypothetical protein